MKTSRNKIFLSIRTHISTITFFVVLGSTALAANANQAQPLIANMGAVAANAAGATAGGNAAAAGGMAADIVNQTAASVLAPATANIANTQIMTFAPTAPTGAPTTSVPPTAGTTTAPSSTATTGATESAAAPAAPSVATLSPAPSTTTPSSIPVPNTASDPVPPPPATTIAPLATDSIPTAAASNIAAANSTTTETATASAAPTPSASLPAGKTGMCWTASIAAPRKGAWRCMIDNSISDPCFSIPNNPNQVLCDANPATKNSGTVVNLLKPLPTDTLLSATSSLNTNAWMLEINDGSHCTVYTGTMPLLHPDINTTTAVRYYCSDSQSCDSNNNCMQQTGIIDGSIKSRNSSIFGQVWKAAKIYYSISANGMNTKIEKIKPVLITRMWR